LSWRGSCSNIQAQLTCCLKPIEGQRVVQIVSKAVGSDCASCKSRKAKTKSIAKH